MSTIFLLYGTSLKDLEAQIEKLMHLCTKINLKLAPSKFVLNTSVKFGRGEKTSDESYRGV